MRALLPITLLVAAASAACSASLIPNTLVEDSTQNRKVVLFCEEYRHAVEDKNIGKLVSMASPQYHSRGTGTHDFVDFDRLKGTLTTDVPKTNAIRYEIKYQRVMFGENNHVLVYFRFAARWKAVKADGSEEWQHRVADNQIDLVPEGDSYKIIAGM